LPAAVFLSRHRQILAAMALCDADPKAY